MSLFASPAMADDRIEQAERTPAKNQSCTGRPVESRLATVGEKWDNVDRTVLRGSLTERNLARICAQKRAFLLPARSQLQKDTLTVMATEDWPVKCRLFMEIFFSIAYGCWARRMQVFRPTLDAMGLDRINPQQSLAKELVELLLQLCVLCFRLLQDGDLGVGVLPERKKLRVCGFAPFCIVRFRVTAP